MPKKIIVILGPTASGKTEMAIKLALRINSKEVKNKFGINGAEIISADSRQIYKSMDIGTGKITKKEMRDIPHHLLNVVSPKKRFTVIQYRKLAFEAINKIFKKGKMPILCGGTGFYIQAVVDGIIIPEVKPDYVLRSGLDKLKTEELFNRLKKLDPKRAKTIEKKNRRRLIRALEIIIKTKKPVPALQKKPLPYPVLIIGIKKEKEELKKMIKKRFLKWLKQGLIGEVKNLRKIGLSWKKIEEFGIHYRVIAQYLQKKTLRQAQGKLSYQEMIENSLKELYNYARRQMTWFKRDKRIYWVKDYKETEKLVKEFLRK